MARKHRLDEELWEDGEEKLSADHVVERFFSQHEAPGHEAQRRPHPAPRSRRHATPPDAEPPERDE